MSGNHNISNNGRDSGYGSRQTPQPPSSPPPQYSSLDPTPPDPPRTPSPIQKQVTLRPRYAHEPRGPNDTLLVPVTTADNHHGGALPTGAQKMKNTVKNVMNVTRWKPKTGSKSPTRGKTGISKTRKPRSPPRSPSTPFCTLEYDAHAMELTYSTNIDYLGLEYRTFSQYATAIQTLQYTISKLKERDPYTYIPHARQQAWVNYVMQLFTDSIERANDSLQEVVDKQRSWLPGNAKRAENMFNRGKYGFLIQRLQLLCVWMKDFQTSFHRMSGSYDSFMEGWIDAKLKAYAPSLQQEVADKRMLLDVYDQRHFEKVYRGETVLEPPRYLIWDEAEWEGYVTKDDQLRGIVYQKDINLPGLFGRSHMVGPL